MSVNNITVRQAINDAMIEEMRRDSNVMLMGEDVSEYEGAYKVSKGMLAEFGPMRVLDTPISEAGFSGLAIGAAYKGLRPIVEFMTWNFGMQAIDQIGNAASKIYYMSGGMIQCPIVFRGPNGPAARVAATHSQCLAATFANYSGVKIIMPSTAENYKGLLKAAIRDNDTVLFLESEIAYNLKGEVPEGEVITQIGKARIAKEGTGLTIVTFGRMVEETLQACADLNVEIIDLQTIKPFDKNAIVKSVQKTHNVLFVEEGLPFAGITSELNAFVVGELWDMLDQQPQRLAGLDVPMPYAANLEAMACPKAEQIREKAKQMLEFR